MKASVLFFLCVAACSATGDELKFPSDFKFGTATASYQVEGGWNADGKGENVWDILTHDHPDWVADRTNGDVACDSYHKYKEDIQLMNNLGVNFYRFSLSWSRILPSGYVNQINQKGIQYYNDLIDDLIAHNITPMVTLYHWDLPQPLQEVGGWPNIILADYFEDYARVAFQNFGDRVKMWITFNEPPQVCPSAYGEGGMAPAYHSDGIGDYLCGRTLLLSHARAYHLYQKEFKSKQNGSIGITIDSRWSEPKTNSSEDLAAAERSMQMNLGWWAHPIYSKEGDYPAIMKQRIDTNSKLENFPRSRLIPFTPEEVKFIQGTHDFFGLNHYTSEITTAQNTVYPTPSYDNDVGVTSYQDSTWPGAASPWLKVVPWGFRKLLNWVKKEYDNPIVYITENGYSDLGELNDTRRIDYHRKYLRALLEAINLDRCNVKGYTIWSLMDNFEWRAGYTQRFGIHHVDFNDPDRKRTPKDSATFYKNVIKTRTVPNS